MTLKGKVSNGTIVLDEPCELPDGSRVEVIVLPPPKAASPLGEMLLRHAGTVPSLPSDMAEQHDHYLHGTPKR